MNLTRCENGHFYDADRFDTCPHCNQTAISTVLQNEAGEPEYTMPMDQPKPAPPEPDPGFNRGFQNDDDTQVTVGFFGGHEPVVGWLVCVEGNHYGEDFKLKSGRNFIGRAAEMDIALTGDASVSRQKHAVVVYEPKGGLFLVQPGDAKELFYLNDKVVLGAAEIHAYDVLMLGKTKLMFIPFCSEKYRWEEDKEEKE